MTRDKLKLLLQAHVADYGARAVCEELVEVFHDHAEELRPKDEPQSKLWRRLGIAMGNTVHFRHLEWPT